MGLSCTKFKNVTSFLLHLQGHFTNCHVNVLKILHFSEFSFSNAVRLVTYTLLYGSLLSVLVHLVASYTTEWPLCSLLSKLLCIPKQGVSDFYR
jgi:hypothetical protein